MARKLRTMDTVDTIFRSAGGQSPYANRNDRSDCLCGQPREDIENRIWWVSEYQDQITPHYYYRCPACSSFSAVNLRFEPDSYSQHHIDAYWISQEKIALNRARVARLMESFQNHRPASPVIYDLGSGEGVATLALKEGFPSATIFAVEADARMGEKFVDAYAGVTFVPEYIETFLDRIELESGHVAVLTDVLEHVLDPIGLLRSTMRALKPGGLAYLTIPNARSYPFPRHVPREQVDWSLANVTRQHLWMLEPDQWLRIVGQHGEIVEYSRIFEERIRRDGDYSSFILRKI